jgi:hypothetical protein
VERNYEKGNFHGGHGRVCIPLSDRSRRRGEREEAGRGRGQAEWHSGGVPGRAATAISSAAVARKN